jgi:hypothetical protein
LKGSSSEVKLILKEKSTLSADRPQKPCFSIVPRTDAAKFLTAKKLLRNMNVPTIKTDPSSGKDP